jgi:hypothetical protein
MVFSTAARTATRTKAIAEMAKVARWTLTVMTLHVSQPFCAFSNKHTHTSVVPSISDESSSEDENNNPAEDAEEGEVDGSGNSNDGNEEEEDGRAKTHQDRLDGISDLLRWGAAKKGKPLLKTIKLKRPIGGTKMLWPSDALLY